MKPEDIAGSETTDRVPEGIPGCRVRSGPGRPEDPAQVQPAGSSPAGSGRSGAAAGQSAPQPLAHAAAAAQLAAAAPAAPAADPDAGLHMVKSPIVGTFYGSPSPGAAPFVSPGDHVEKGQVICIVEAMKLMNEIEVRRRRRDREVPRHQRPAHRIRAALFSIRLRMQAAVDSRAVAARFHRLR